MSKHILHYKLHIVPCTVTFIYGKEKFNAHMKKHYPSHDIEMTYQGQCVSVLDDVGNYRIYIGLVDFNNGIEEKSLLVHEISHATTYIMGRYGFTDDEFRAYFNQMLYVKFIKRLDKIYSKKMKKKKK